MSKFLNIFLSIILIVIWIISGGFITQANVFIQYHRDDDYLKKAYLYSFSASFITWFIVGVFVLIIVLACFGVIEVIGSASSFASKSGIAVKVFLICSFILTFVTGILSVLTAIYLQISNEKNKSFSIKRLHQAYIDSIISSCMCLVSTILLIISFFLFEYLKHRKKTGKELETSEDEDKKLMDEAKNFSKIEDILNKKSQ